MTSPLTKAVLLMAHGTPDSLDEMPEYLAHVRGGRLPSPELVKEMRHNYAAIGGRSPLTDRTRDQAVALAGVLAGQAAVYVGMRNWTPFIADALRLAAEDGIQEIVALPLAPQYSTLSVGKYRQAVERAQLPGITVSFVDSWHAHPDLLEAFAEKVRAAAPQEGEAVIFTAHSLPERVIAEGDPYADQVAATAQGVAERAGVREYTQAWQSAGRTEEPWLKPSLEERLGELADRGVTQALVVPVGFVADHTEILYDIDVQAQAFARERSLALRRTESLNAAPTFIRALADIVRARLG
ncbi:MAG TPA: ferrochelatase [Vicinamibacteria bacterium]